MNWKGKVTVVNEKDWGSKTIWSWQLAGVQNMWFRSENDPYINKGDCISFDGESPNKIKTIEQVEESEVKLAATASNGKSGSSEVPPTSSPDYWRWKQMYDLSRTEYFDWRDARADATRIVCAALDNDVLALGAKKGLKLDILIGQIKDTTEMLMRSNKDE